MKFWIFCRKNLSNILLLINSLYSVFSVRSVVSFCSRLKFMSRQKLMLNPRNEAVYRKSRGVPQFWSQFYFRLSAQLLTQQLRRFQKAIFSKCSHPVEVLCL